MNLYGRLDQFKLQAGGITGNADDTHWLMLLASVSRAIDAYCGRHFYARTATRTFDGTRDSRIWTDDLISVTTLSCDLNADGVYEQALVANTDFGLWPTSQPSYMPYRGIDLLPWRTAISVWPTVARSIQIAGSWGYSAEWETVTGYTVQDNPLTSGATTLTLTSNHGIQPGETLLIESEQVSVTAAPTQTTLTIERAYNGTTAAQHASSTAVSRRRYPRPIEQAAVMQAIRWAWEAQGGMQGSVLQTEYNIGAGRTLYPMIRDSLEPFRLKALVA